jgi:hypothetical protein
MLPKVSVPIYELNLPSSGKPVKIRPFTVKEEKLLLMALNSKDDNQIIETTKQVINNCILSEEVDVEKLPFFDVDYLFIALRAKSVGEAIEVNFICNNVLTDSSHGVGLGTSSKCSMVFPVPIDISKVEVSNKNMEKTIRLTDSIVVKMKYPSYEVMKRLVDNEDDISRKVKVIVESLDMIIDGDKIYSSKDHSKEELEQFVEGFTDEQFKRISVFVDNFPGFEIIAEKQCPKCGFNHRIRYKDFTSFFQ